MPINLDHVGPEEYLACERVAEYKSEYVNGHVSARVGSNPEHSLITGNVHTALNNALRERPCLVFNSDMKVQVPISLNFYYPDVSVVCDKPCYAEAVKDVLLNPLLICEIFAPQNAFYKREEKFMAYREIESCQEYLLIERDRPHATRYVRRSSNQWLRADIFGLKNEVKVESLGVTLPLSEIYRMVKFPATETDAPAVEQPSV